MTDPGRAAEDHHAAWAWLILTAATVVYVVAFDVWASRTRHLLMTSQFRLWLHDPAVGPFIFGAWAGVIAGLTYHFLVKGAPP